MGAPSNTGRWLLRGCGTLSLVSWLGMLAILHAVSWPIVLLSMMLGGTPQTWIWPMITLAFVVAPWALGLWLGIFLVRSYQHRRWTDVAGATLLPWLCLAGLVAGMWWHAPPPRGPACCVPHPIRMHGLR